jgi:hypothetical protein
MIPTIDMESRKPVGEGPLDARARIAFVPETRGDPLGSHPTLRLDDLPYNGWLSERILDPVLTRWFAGKSEPGDKAERISHDVEWASERCRRAFQQILPAAAALGEPAVLAAMGVTANLQRTLGWIAEHLLDGRLQRGKGDSESLPRFPLSRLWCGLIDYPENAPYFPGRVRLPIHPTRLNPRRRDPRHLANALWCSVGEIHARCDEALDALRAGILQSGLFHPEDLRHLHSDAFPAR